MPKPPTVMVEDPATHKVDIRTTAPPRQKRDEQYWRSRAADLRQKLARARADLAAAQSNLDSLQRSQQPAAVRERQVVGGLVERLQVEVRQHEGDIAKLETQAASSGVPPTWVR